MNLIFKRVKANTFLTSSLAMAEFLFWDRGDRDAFYLNYYSANVSLKMKTKLRQFQTHKTKGCIQADGLVLRKFRNTDQRYGGHEGKSNPLRRHGSKGCVEQSPKQTCLRGRAVIHKGTEVSGANGLNYKPSDQVTGSCFKKT